jgi:enoyl-CoA hydratase/3-hydroxyacyl-CoA dehydrogenase
MNALNETVIAQLDQCFSAADKNEAVDAIVFQGAGKAFVAGADIRYFVQKIKANKISDIYDFTSNGHELLLKIENSTKRTMAILDGLSLGGGSELALACQAIIATPAGSMGFPETGIGIFPGLGGMLRTARMIGPELAKYYVFTGTTMTAQDAHELGILTKLVTPTEVDSAVQELISGDKPDKYRRREIPDRLKPLARVCSAENVTRLLAGEPPQGVAEELAAKASKVMGFKAPIALKLSNEIIDQQDGKSMEDAVQMELGRLHDIFSTADALEGLSNIGRRVEFKGA